VFVAIYMRGRWWVLRAIILLKLLRYELRIRGVYGVSQTQKAQTGERRAPPTPALMVESALAPPSAMKYSSGVLRGPELPVTGPTSAISYPILT